jgi:hypothetical protein
VSTDQIVKETLKGKWFKYQAQFIRITVLKDLGFISSTVSDKEFSINLDMMSHEAFYLEILNGITTTYKLIEKNASINLTIETGTQIKGVFHLS